MRFADFSALKSLEEDLPKTKQRASKTFDFPAPLGPSTQLKFPPNNISVCFAKDLKPCITILFILVAFNASAAIAIWGIACVSLETCSSMRILLCWYYLKFILLPRIINIQKNK